MAEVKIKKSKAAVAKQILVDKLETEFLDVNDRLKRLEAALAEGEAFQKKVGGQQYELLLDQRKAMETYRNILAIRLELVRFS